MQRPCTRYVELHIGESRADRRLVRQAQVQQYVHNLSFGLMKRCTALNSIADSRSCQRKAMHQ